MTHPNKSAITPRSRRFKLAAAASAVAVVSGTALALTASPAQAATQNFQIYSQIAAAYQGTPTNEGVHPISLTVTPASAAANAAIEVRISSSSLYVFNGPIAAVTSGTNELDAVIALNGVDYTLRGSVVGQNVPANTGTWPTLYDGGWVISSTAGQSSSTSTVPPTVAGSSGFGATIRGAEGTSVGLTAPGSSGTYPITLKALIANSTASPSSVAVNDQFDVVFNTAVATNTSNTVANNGPKNSFDNNVSSSYFTFSSPVTITVP